ncbi:hypothetical protein F5Y13DRAFT_92627 [Hypoxylon sp. FL1857]|nr:hypothetical protein F5Y13DRAFT_92627 [Hypoxylon sp. FL1857]
MLDWSADQLKHHLSQLRPPSLLNFCAPHGHVPRRSEGPNLADADASIVGVGPPWHPIQSPSSLPRLDQLSKLPRLQTTVIIIFFFLICCQLILLLLKKVQFIFFTLPRVFLLFLILTQAMPVSIPSMRLTPSYL